jgi:glucoamylase
LAAGGDARYAIRSMEGFATGTGLLPEQVWDRDDLPCKHLRRGRPTGAAVPLMWAHAEYLKLLRSVRDGKVFDLIPEVSARYLGERKRCRKLRVWSALSKATIACRGETLRVIADAAFLLHWSPDNWRTLRDTPSKPTRLGFEFVDIAIAQDAQEPLRFTFYWPDGSRWEGKDYTVEVAA